MQKVFELAPRAFVLAESLFTDAWFDRAFVDSVFEGSVAGRVFVDDPKRPQVAFLKHPSGECYVAGVAEPAMTDFIVLAPAESGAFDDRTYLYPLSEDWEDAIKTRAPNSWGSRGRRMFQLKRRPSAGWRYRLPSGARAVSIDRALAERMDAERGWRVGPYSGGYDAYGERGFGFYIELNGEVASVIHSAAVSSSEAVINVWTEEPFRRNGYATLAGYAFVEHAAVNGVSPTWSCDDWNEASAATALKVGFREARPYRQFYPTEEFRPTAGVWTRRQSEARDCTAAFERD